MVYVAGSAFAPDPPESVVEVPLPSFDALGEQASLDGLSIEHLQHFREKVVAEPAPVMRATVKLTNDGRSSVPTTLVCCSIPSVQVLELAQGGDARCSPRCPRSTTSMSLIFLPGTGLCGAAPRLGRSDQQHHCPVRLTDRLNNSSIGPRPPRLAPLFIIAKFLEAS